MKLQKSTFLAAALSSACLLTSSLADTVAVYDIEGAVSENGQSSASLLNLGSAQGRPRTHFDIVQSLKAAATDDEVKAIVLDIDSAGLSLAQLQEIRRHLLTLREAKKDVWLYTENLTIGTALLGSAANHLTLMPEGGVSLTGLYGESMYFKGLLDKVGVTAEVIHIGDFKSAGETFYRTEPSEYAAKQQDALFDSLYAQLIDLVAEGRGIEKDALKALVDHGALTPEEALKSKLVDKLAYRTDFINEVRAQYGEEAEFDRSYEMPDTEGPQIDGMMDMVKLMFKSSKKRRSLKDYVAVIVLEGNITDASIAPVRTEILKATRDEKCKGLVLRVNSPGGSALASDVLWEATDEFKATGRPFAASMGAVAASGGYYVSAGADKIFAEEGTITGSIGVVGMKFVMGGALEKLGITTHGTKRGKHADLYTTSRGYTAEETQLIKDSMLDVYGTFKQRIIDGRGDRIKGDLEKLAGGRVYSGRDALSIGLVDQIGGLNEAITFVATQAKLEDYKIDLIPEPKGPFDGMFAPASDKDQHEFIQAHVPSSPAIQLRSHILQSAALRLLSPSQQRQIETFVNKVEAFQKDQILLIAPPIPKL